MKDHRTEGQTMFDTRFLRGILVASLLVAGLACDLPLDPGSDRPDGAPPAKLGPMIDTGADVTAEEGTDITGQFDLVARVSSSFNNQVVEVPMRAIADQSGEISSGRATVTLELRRADAPDKAGASTDEAAAIDTSGAFQATVTGFTIPADSSTMLEEDTTADVELDAQIVDADCFGGDSIITMKNVKVSGSTIPEVVLEGPFDAHRVGASCSGGAGGDTGIAGDTDGGT